MPIYEYQCTGCNHHFDVMQKVDAEPVTQCPACQAHSVVKLVSAAGFQLKGTGWYATDFKDKGNPKKEASNKNNDSGKNTESGTKDKVSKDSVAKSTTVETNTTK